MISKFKSDRQLIAEANIEINKIKAVLCDLWYKTKRTEKIVEEFRKEIEEIERGD